MRIALLSDVHGNLSGLRAVHDALTREPAVDHVVVAGDLLQGGPRPREVWAFLAELGWTLVRGNEDAALVEAPAAHPTHAQAYQAAITWTRAQLDPGTLGALAALPFSSRLPTPAGDLLVVHSSPRSLDDRCGGPHNTAAEVAAAYAGTGASAIAFGHYHRSFVRPMPFALLINVASVGLPLYGRIRTRGIAG
ncbi:MAG: metallophosphoesterase family protein [Chloroflexi bacterium]|nr:metallophosphoesterase family protein [Chloroflexota bacterium]